MIEEFDETLARAREARGAQRQPRSRSPSTPRPRTGRRAGTRPTVNLYLYDIRDDLARRDAAWYPTYDPDGRTNGPPAAPPPLQALVPRHRLDPAAGGRAPPPVGLSRRLPAPRDDGADPSCGRPLHEQPLPVEHDCRPPARPRTARSPTSGRPSAASSSHRSTWSCSYRSWSAGHAAGRRPEPVARGRPERAVVASPGRSGRPRSPSSAVRRSERRAGSSASAHPRRRRSARRVADPWPVTAVDPPPGTWLALGLVEARVRAAVAERRSTDPDPDDRFRGLYVSDAQVETILAGGAAPRLGICAGTGEVAAALAAVEAAADADEAAGARIRLRDVARAFGLEPLDVELLLVALAPDLDPRFERLYGYLNDDVSRRRASIGLALRLCGATVADGQARSRLGASGPLVAGKLLEVEDPDRPFLTRGLRVPDRVARHLLGDDTPDAAIAGLWSAAPRSERPASAASPAAEAMRQLERSFRHGGRLAYLHERIGADGRRAAVASLASLSRRCDDPPSCSTWSGSGRTPTSTSCPKPRVARRVSWAPASLPVPSSRSPSEERGAVRQLADLACRVVLHGSRGWDPAWSSDVPLLLEPSAASAEERSLAWKAGWTACPSRDLAAAATRYPFRISASGITRAAVAGRVAAEAAGSTGRARGPCRGRACPERRRARAAGAADRAPGRLGRSRPAARHPRAPARPGEPRQASRRGARPVGPGRPEPRSRRHRPLRGRLRHRARRCRPRSSPASSVSTSTSSTSRPSSTSTSARPRRTSTASSAEADRRERRAALRRGRRDLRQALRGPDAHDRYANVEIAYLLQRMERFDGMAILTTNLRANLDEAFLRRLDAIVDFPMPESERPAAALGAQPVRRRCRPATTSTSTSWPARFRFSGGNIRNIVAAPRTWPRRRAAAGGMADLIRGTGREYRKLGQLSIEAEFGPYFPLVAAPDRPSAGRSIDGLPPRGPRRRRIHRRATAR